MQFRIIRKCLSAPECNLKLWTNRMRNSCEKIRLVGSCFITLVVVSLSVSLRLSQFFYSPLNFSFMFVRLISFSKAVQSHFYIIRFASSPASSFLAFAYNSNFSLFPANKLNNFVYIVSELWKCFPMKKNIHMWIRSPSRSERVIRSVWKRAEEAEKLRAQSGERSVCTDREHQSDRLNAYLTALFWRENARTLNFGFGALLPVLCRSAVRTQRRKRKNGRTCRWMF